MNEVENTFRALKDDIPLATSIWCGIGLHKWTKYTPPATKPDGGYQLLYQLRGCDHCGLVQMKVLRRS
jgi:hypothetical protein